MRQPSAALMAKRRRPALAKTLLESLHLPRGDASAAATSGLLIHPASAAATKPARGNSLRLIVKVSMRG